MKDGLFEELVSSVREGGVIVRGERAAARRTVFADPDVAGIRRLLGVSQAEFALMLGISERTLQNWEQRRRRPIGPARVLLRLAEERSDVFAEIVCPRSAI